MDWTIALSIASFALAVFSVITVIQTLKQNHRMIEESTRPIINVYTSQINTGSPELYFVVKNFGNSAATITEFKADCDFRDFLKGHDHYSEDQKKHFDPINNLRGALIAPGQSRICSLEFKDCPKEVTFNLSYQSGAGKTYTEKMTVDLRAGTGTVIGKHAGKTADEHMMHISYTLQELLQKQL